MQPTAATDQSCLFFQAVKMAKGTRTAAVPVGTQRLPNLPNGHVAMP
jgi:hypothetical protein